MLYSLWEYEMRLHTQRYFENSTTFLNTQHCFEKNFYLWTQFFLRLRFKLTADWFVYWKEKNSEVILKYINFILKSLQLNH